MQTCCPPSRFLRCSESRCHRGDPWRPPECHLLRRARHGVVGLAPCSSLSLGISVTEPISGAFPIKDMYQATLDFIHSNSQLSAPFEFRRGSGLDEGRTLDLWPVFWCAQASSSLGSSLLQNTLRARVAAVRGRLHGGILGVPVRFHRGRCRDMVGIRHGGGYDGVRDAGNTRRTRPPGGLALAMDLSGRSGGDRCGRSRRRVDQGTAISVFHGLRTHVAFLLIVLIAAYAAAWMMAVAPNAIGQVIALAAFCAIVAAITLTPANNLGDGETGNFSPLGPYELAGYQAAYKMVRLIASKDRPASRRCWDDLYGFADISWANLPHQGGGIENVFAPTPIPVLTPAELDLLKYPTTARVLAMSQSEVEIAGAVPALSKAGLVPQVEKAGTWADGKLYYELIKLDDDEVAETHRTGGHGYGDADRRCRWMRLPRRQSGGGGSRRASPGECVHPARCGDRMQDHHSRARGRGRQRGGRLVPAPYRGDVRSAPNAGDTRRHQDDRRSGEGLRPGQPHPVRGPA